MSFENELKIEIEKQGADFIYFVDISQLPVEQNRKFPRAILIVLPLSPAFIQKVTDIPDYVQKMIFNKQFSDDEFLQKEKTVDKIADHISYYLVKKGYSACSQSEESNFSAGLFNEKTKSSSLPHKTIAGFAGLGWIGKHNLLVTPDFGSAICMCSVLTDAPLTTVLHTPAESLCKNCTICKDICPVNAIKGNIWTLYTTRDELVDVYKCTTCLRCLALCPWTQKYKDKIF